MDKMRFMAAKVTILMKQRHQRKKADRFLGQPFARFHFWIDFVESSISLWESLIFYPFPSLRFLAI